MLLDSLVKGSVVNLEIVSGEEKYEITSRVMGTAKNSILIENVKAGRELLSLDKAAFDKAVYNLYADDPNGNRVGWYNVVVKPIDYNDRSYRGIYTWSFNHNSTDTDRRTDKRIRLVDVVGRVETKDREIIEVPIYDISNNGIAFLGDGEDFLHKRLTIHIEDTVNNERYQINIDCTCVREVMEDGKVLYGCSIGEAERSYLTYLFEKRLSEKRQATLVG